MYNFTGDLEPRRRYQAQSQSPLGNPATGDSGSLGRFKRRGWGREPPPQTQLSLRLETTGTFSSKLGSFLERAELIRLKLINMLPSISNLFYCLHGLSFCFWNGTFEINTAYAFFDAFTIYFTLRKGFKNKGSLKEKEKL